MVRLIRPLVIAIPLAGLLLWALGIAAPGSKDLASSRSMGFVTVKAPAPAMMACSNSNGSISPCTSSTTVNVSTSGNTASFTITNSGASYREGGVSCTFTTPISSCSVNPTDYALNGHTSQNDVLTYAVGGTPGTGSVTITTGGTLGILNATLTVTVVQPYGVTVTPAATMPVYSLEQESQLLTVRNTGTASGTFNLTVATCSGGASSCLLQPPTQVTLAANQTADVYVSWTAGAVGTTATVALTATLAGNGNITATGTVTPPVTAAVAVSPDNAQLNLAPATAASQVFTVVNRHPYAATYNLMSSCSPSLTGCSVTTSSLLLPSLGAAIDTVTYTSGSGGTTGTAALIAKESTDTLNRDSGWVSVAALAVSPCATSGTSVSPCTNGNLGAIKGTGGLTASFQVTNYYSHGVSSYSVHCQVGGVVSSCSVPNGLILNALETKNVLVTYSVKESLSTGMLTLSVMDDIGTIYGNVRVSTYRDPNSSGPPTPLRVFALSPHFQSLEKDPSQTDTARFTLTNASSDSNRFNYSRQCVGVAIASGCTPATDTVTLAPSGTKTLSVGYTSSSTIGATGTVSLIVAFASDTTNRDSARLGITISRGTTGVSIAQANPGTTVDRDLCLTVSAGAGAGYECGDLRLVHAMPSVRTYGKVRTPTLLYNTAHARPTIILRADETLPIGGALPTTVSVLLKGPAGDTLGTGSWAGSQWTSGSTRRIAVAFDASAKATGIYPYTIQVTRTYPGPSTSTDTVSGEYVVVNRKNSMFGPGWWLAGFEQLFQPGTATMLWVGGDGSARKYTQLNDSTWAAANVNRRDRMMKRGTNFERLLPNGLIVRFDSAGRHIATANRLGQVTMFKYNSATLPFRLDSIIVPPIAAKLAYTFVYDSLVGYGLRLRRVNAPPVIGQLRFDSLAHNASHQITVLRHLDGSTVSFAYDPNVALNRITSRTNESGYTTNFTFDAGGLLTQVTVPLTATTNAVTTFTAAESRGLSGTPAVTSELTTTKMDGPRTDVADTTVFWLDRFGEPRRIRNALGDETILTRADPIYAALVTRLQQPSGQIMGAAYDTLGHIVLSTDSASYDPVRQLYAATRFTWEPKWDVVTRMINPEGDSSMVAYNTNNGNMVWRLDGRGDSTRTYFRYWPIGDNFGGQLSAVVSPNGATDSLSYDGYRWNLAMITRPLWEYVAYTTDTIGRVIGTVSPVTRAGVTDSLLTYFDLLDQDTLTLHVAGGDTVRVRQHFAISGLVDTLRKRSAPDINGIDTITQVFAYDRAGRKITETLVGYSTIGWSYDPAGNLLSGGRKNYSNTYDAVGRLATQSPAWGGGGRATLTYDATGHLLTANNANARITRTYNLNGSMRTDVLRISNKVLQDSIFANSYLIQYGFDLDGRLVTLKHPSIAPSTSSATYVYNAQAGFLQSVTDILGNRFSWTYDRAGRPVRDTMMAQSATPIRETITYDSLSRLSSRMQWTTGQACWPMCIHNDLMQYDLRDKPVKNYYTLDTVAYKPIGPVSLASYQTATGPEEYTLDALGNRLQAKNSVVYHHSTDNYRYWPHSDRLKLIWTPNSPFPDTTIYFEDANGTVYEHRGVHSWGWSTAPYRELTDILNTYDGAGNLIANSYTLDTVPNYNIPHYQHYTRKEIYRYDALGRRVWQQMIRDTSCWNHDQSSGCRNEVTRTIWDGSNVLYEIRVAADARTDTMLLNSNTDPTSSTTFTGIVGYTNAGGIDKPLDLFKGGQVVALYRDWQGRFDYGTCPTSLCNGSNPLFPAAHETIFGSGSTDVQPFGPPSWYGSVITGGSDGSGYQYKRNRYYDPATGRFTQEDPIGLAGGLNAYGFADGDPVSFSDPFGLCGHPGEPPCPNAESGAAMAEAFRQLGQSAHAIKKAVAVFAAVSVAGGVLGAAVLNPGTMTTLAIRGSVAAGTAVPIIASAQAKLGELAARFQVSSAALVNMANSAEKFVDNRPDNLGNINALIPRLDGAAGFIRVTFDPQMGKIISAGMMRAEQVNNLLANGGLTPISP